MTGKGAKAIFEAEVICHKEELYARLSKVEKKREDHSDMWALLRMTRLLQWPK